MKIRMKAYFRQIHNNEGITLVMVMMVLVILSVLGLGILGLAGSNMNLNSIEHDQQAVYYIAEAGLAHAESEIETKVMEAYESSSSAPVFYGKLEPLILGNSTLEEFRVNSGKAPTAAIKVERGMYSHGEKTRTYTITSKGTIEKRNRTVEREVTIDWKNKGGGFNLTAGAAVYTNSLITLDSGSRIEGNIGTNSTEASSIKIENGSAITEGIIFVPEQAKDIAVEGKFDNPIEVRPPVAFTLPPFPDFPKFPESDKEMKDTLKLKENVDFQDLVVTGPLTIDTGEEDRKITIGHLDLSNGSISITGKGNLTVYVRDTITLDNSSLNKGGAIGKLTFYVKGSKSIELARAQHITGSLYAESANINVTGQDSFKGNLFTGGSKVLVEGKLEDILIYAPKAVVEISHGARVDGAVFSDSLLIDNGARLAYDPAESENIPFTLENDDPDTNNLIEKSPIIEKTKE